MKLVTIHVRTVGQKFGCVGVVLDAHTRRKLAATRTYPYGFSGAAVDGARAIIQAHKNWKEVLEDDLE